MTRSTMRTATIAATGAYSLQAVVLAIVLALTGALHPLPVLAVFRVGAASTEVAISSVDLGWALVALLVGGAVTHALLAAKDAGSDAERAAARSRALLGAGWSQGSAIIVFLIAQLNGISELTTLVPLYAITATAVVLVGIDRGREPTWLRPGAWGAVVGIVPWGLIAFAQIGATFALAGPSLPVRVVTLMGLAIAICGWTLGWRRHDGYRASDVAIMTIAVSALVWAIVGFAVL